MKLGKLIKVGVQVGIVWSIADTVKAFVDDATGIIMAKPVIKLQQIALKYEKTMRENNSKLKEARDARKKEESAEEE